MTPSKEKLSQNICEYIPEPILLLDEKGDIQYANQFAEQFFELSLEKLVGKRFFDYTKSQYVTKIKKGLNLLSKNSESSILLSFDIQVSSGRKIHVEATIRNLLDDATINGFLVIMRDVSAKKKIENELKHTQNELKKSVEQMEFIMDNTLDVIFQVKLTGEYTFMNSASKIIAGYDPKDMIGTKWMEYVPKKELPRYLSKVKELLSGKKITDFETFVIHKEGHLVPVEFSGNVVKKDKKIYINGVMRDLSKRIDSKQHLEDIAKKLEQQVEDRKNELEDLHEKLHESEAKYRALFMNLPDGAGVTDEHGDTIIDINAKLASSFHKTPEELIGKSWKDLLPEKVFNERYIYGRRAIETNTVQCHHDQRAGMYFQTFYVPITLPNGEKIAYFVARDITTLKRQEDQIKQNEERYRMLFEHANEAIVVAQDGYLKLVNPMFVEMVGRPEEEIYPMPFIEFIHPQDRKIVLERYQQRLAGKHPPHKYEIRAIDGSGETRWIRVNAVTFAWDGKPATLTFISDITERKNAERDLADSEQQFRTVTESAQDAIIMIDEDGKVILWNNAAERIFGYKTKEILHKQVHNLIADTKQQKRFFDAFKDFRKTGKGHAVGKTQELTALKKGNISFPIEISLSSVKIRDKWNAIAIVRDISERKELEKNLLDSYRMLEKRVQERTVELKESEARYRNLFEFAPVGIGISNKDGTVIDANKNMIKIMGHSKLSDLKKVNLKDLYVDSGDRNRLLEVMKKTGSVRDYLVILKKKNGETYHALLDIDLFKRDGEEFFFTTVRDVTEMVNTQNQMAETRDFLRNVIDGASEFIMTVDASMNILMWNKTAVELTGYKRKDLVGTSLRDCDCFENAAILADHVKNSLEGHTAPLEDIIIHPKTSGKRVLRLSSSKIFGRNREVTGFLFVGYDITNLSTVHGKLLQGSSYLILEESLKPSIDLFANLQMNGYTGLFFSRGNPISLKNLLSPLDPEMYIFNETTLVDAQTIVVLDDIYSRIETFIKTNDVSVLLLDRIDYLIVLYSFKDVLHFLYRVNALISDYHTILLLHLNPRLLEDTDLAYLRQEFQMLPVQKIDSMRLDDNLYDLLLFVNEQNKKNISVSYQKIGTHFGISKVTTQKRVNELERQGLIGVKIKGRMKTVFVTKTGESLLHRRDAA